MNKEVYYICMFTPLSVDKLQLISWIDVAESFVSVAL